MTSDKTEIRFRLRCALIASLLLAILCGDATHQTKDPPDKTAIPVTSFLHVKLKTVSPSTQTLNSLSQTRTEDAQFKSKWTEETKSKKQTESSPRGKQHRPQLRNVTVSTTVTASEKGILLQTNKDSQNLNTGSTNSYLSNETPSHQSVTYQTTLTNGKTSVAESSATEFKLYYQNCFNTEFKAVVGAKGTVVGMFDTANGSATEFIYCTFSIPISKGYKYLYLLFHQPEEICSGAHSFQVSSSTSLTSRTQMIPCKTYFYQMFSEQTVYVTVFYDRDKHKEYGIFNSTVFYPNFRVDFESYNEDIRKHLMVTRQTSDSGYISHWGYDGITNYLCVNNATYQLHLADNHAVMLSFARFDLSIVFTDTPFAGLWVYSTHRLSGKRLIFREGRHAVVPANVYFTSLFFHFKTQKFCEYCKSGFRVYFSFHNMSHKPIKLKNGLFNCSQINYPTFQKHLECNLELECHGAEDEGEHCPFSSPECKGMVSSGHKCYAYINWRKPLSFFGAQAECLRRNGDLAMMKTESEWRNLMKLFQFGKHFLRAWIGVKSMGQSFNPVYKHMMKWVDNSIAQNVHVVTDYKVTSIYFKSFNICGVLKHSQKRDIDFEICKEDKNIYFFICQYAVSKADIKNVTFPLMSFPKSTRKNRNHALILCPEGHVTHGFLSCDYKSRCAINEKYVPKCRVRKQVGYFSVTMYVCDDGAMTLPYSLVCDFRQDCEDASDETFCVHDPVCEGFRCHNGQCIQTEKRCNREKDCLDESDEHSCKDDVKSLPGETLIFPQMLKLPPPVKIDFDINGRMLQRALKQKEPCPNSHFQCMEPYCLPIYLFCNDVIDCPHGEDELDCQSHQCPGYYRCRSSSVCVHADHLCDGFPQCPQHDDEWLCHAGCPDVCLCQGLALRCFKSFSTYKFSMVRYLDAAGSTMKLDDTQGLGYIVYLSLERCRLHQVSESNLPNLRILNLKSNQLTSLDFGFLATLRNLKTLLLSGNPLAQISCGKREPMYVCQHLRFLDLSSTSLGTFTSAMISCAENLTHLDISSSQIHTILQTGFSKTPHLKWINLRGNPTNSYPQNMFHQLDALQTILTDDYRFCCHQSLPDTFPMDGTCVSYQAHLSSCEDLIQHFEHRVLLFIVMVFAVVGNSLSLVLKLCIQKNVLSSSMDFLLTNVHVMDLLMGLYSLVMVTADWINRHNYFSIRHVWTKSPLCKTAGFVAYVSFHASSCTLFFISIQGFLSTYSHKFKTRLTKRVVQRVTAIIWTGAVVLSLVPLVTPGMEFFGQTDNCIFLALTVKSGPGFTYDVVIMAILHLLLPSFTFLSQLLILWVKHFRDDLYLSITERSLKMAEATRMFPIISLDCVRRYVFCLIRLMGLLGLALPDKMHALYSFFILPTNSALNPLLYVVSVVMERRRQAAEQRLLQRLARRLAQHKGMAR